jgi:peptidoglycan/LPS O-acetylase OafA/YrhL
MPFSGGEWRLGHRASLDGVRAVAVLLVLTTHLRVPHLGEAPAVGVAVFFALSGFLITTLLVERREPLRLFYLRRVARLAPALVVCLVIYVALRFCVTGSVDDWRMVVRGGTYTANWYMAAGDFEWTSGVRHLWSLAIEEQFYLAWPLLLLVLVRLPRTWRLAAVGLAIGASLLARIVVYPSPGGYFRAYYATASRLDELLVGCLLALLVPGHREVRAPGWVATLLLASVASLAWVPDPEAIILVPILVALLSAAAIWVCVQGGGPSWLAAGWLTWVGRRSYAIYLYHLPLQWVAEQWGVPWWAGAPAVVAATFALAEVSWRYVEEPVLRRARGARRSRVEVAVPHGGLPSV